MKYRLKNTFAIFKLFDSAPLWEHKVRDLTFLSTYSNPVGFACERTNESWGSVIFWELRVVGMKIVTWVVYKIENTKQRNIIQNILPTLAFVYMFPLWRDYFFSSPVKILNHL